MKPLGWPVGDDKKVALFLSRLHWKKGIDMLLNAWVELRARFPEWNLAVAGTGETAFVDACKRQAGNLGIGETVSFLGYLSDEERSWALANADLYVLPSREENFGNSVAEALAVGTPVVTTTATPWEAWVDGQCGWICQPTVPDLLVSLSAAMGCPEDRLASFGVAGARLIETEFSIESVLDKLDQTYSWMLGGERPAGIMVE
jgi:glycosyltransferase involved in cell wall biosynthesis